MSNSRVETSFVKNTVGNILSGFNAALVQKVSVNAFVGQISLTLAFEL